MHLAHNRKTRAARNIILPNNEDKHCDILNLHMGLPFLLPAIWHFAPITPIGTSELQWGDENRLVRRSCTWSPAGEWKDMTSTTLWGRARVHTHTHTLMRSAHDRTTVARWNKVHWGDRLTKIHNHQTNWPTALKLWSHWCWKAVGQFVWWFKLHSMKDIKFKKNAQDNSNSDYWL
jgi:hypothetical protein